MATKATPSKPAAKPAPSKPAAKASAAVVVKEAGAVANPMAALAKFAKRGAQQLAKMPVGMQTVSFRGGVITIGGVRVGNAIPIIPLAEQFERSYYAREYDANDKSPPDCYSFDNITPHEKASNKQSDACESCEHNAWGSGPRGRGKACKEGMRLAFMRYDKISTTDDVENAGLLQCKFSVINTQAIQPVLTELYEKCGHPAGMICELSANPDDAIQIRNGLAPIDPLPKELQEAVIARLDAAVALVEQPYPEPDANAPKASAKPAPRARKF